MAWEWRFIKEFEEKGALRGRQRDQIQALHGVNGNIRDSVVERWGKGCAENIQASIFINRII